MEKNSMTRYKPVPPVTEAGIIAKLQQSMILPRLIIKRHTGESG